MSIAAEQHRYFLTILIWAFILEIIVIVYYLSKGDYGFTMQLTCMLMTITIAGIYAIIHRIRKEIREGM
ncbi:MAG: hypothetical protein QXT53_04310 [Ignisphaera sp.]